MVCDAASIAVMIERIGCYNARWRRIKRSDYLGSLDKQDMLNKEIDDTGQQPESSLSGESSASSSSASSDSSRCSEMNLVSKRQRVSSHPEGTSHAVSMAAAKVSSSSETPEQSYNNSQNFKSNTCSSDDTDKETPMKRQKMDTTLDIASFHSKVSRTSSHHPILSPAYLNMVNVERISAFYAVNEDDMSILDDVLMCPFVFRTQNAVLCGALTDCVVPGMLRANFSKNNKLLSMELVFDAMGFMQQLDGANGGNINAQVIPGSLEMALVPCPNEARVITEATSPYRVIHVNEQWTRLTSYTQTEAEGKPLLHLLQCDSSGSGADESLEDVTNGRPACSTSIHHRKIGKSFVDFMCSYPLTK
jgi:PAS domain-containing protein